jgi:hypothetical protein
MREIEKKVRIRQKIKYMQKKLDHAIINNQDCTNELIELSQEIDKLIVDYYYLDSDYFGSDSR